jgi:hypothetical protein
MDIKALRKLPEIASAIFSSRIETLPDGVTVCIDEPRLFYEQPAEVADVFSFVDVDGRLMRPIMTADGLAKVRL